MRFIAHRGWFKVIAVIICLTFTSPHPPYSSKSASDLLAPSSSLSPHHEERDEALAGRQGEPASARAVLAPIIFLAVLFGGSFLGTLSAWAQDGSGQRLFSKGVSEDRSGSVPVVRVVDGDTIIVLIKGKEESIRFCAINTPEVSHRGEKIVDRDPYGKEAAELCQSLIEAGGGMVWLEAETDNKLANRGRYDRLLRYVWVRIPDPENTGKTIKVMVNLKLVELGAADLYWPKVEKTKYYRELLKAWRNAKDGKLGMWAPELEEERAKAKKKKRKRRRRGSKMSSLFPPAFEFSL